MKKLLFILFLFSISINAQSWNSIITTTTNISNVDYIENHADKDGIHIVTYDDYTDDIKYYLISSSGSSIRSATISTNGEFPNIVGDENAVYIVYREGSNIRVKKSTDAGANWTQRANLSIGFNECSGIDAAINVDGIHTVWSIGDSYGEYMETKYKRFDEDDNAWYDFKTVTDYTNGYGVTPTVTLSPNRIHVGYNSYDMYDPPYFSFDADEMTRTKYNSTWQTQQQIATSESGKGVIFAADSKLYDFYYDYYSAGLGQFGHHLNFKYRTFGSTSWSSSTQLEYTTNVTNPIVVCETTNGNIHTFTDSTDNLMDRVIVNGSIDSYTSISSSGGILAQNCYAVHNDVYVNWKADNSNYLKLRQLDSAPATPETLSSTSYNNHPKLYWDENNEPDIDYYKVYKSQSVNGTYTFLSNTSNPYYVDNSETIYFPGGGNIKKYVYYKIKAVDNSNNISDFSDSRSVAVNGSSSSDKIAGEEVINETIRTYELFSNYPNPFNPTTQISYQIPNDGFVNLTVYNSLGQEVAKLVNQHQSIGKYTVQFNASNLSSGIYIYKLQAGEFGSVRKMILAK